MIDLLQEALQEGREENAELLGHLALLQEIVGLGDQVGSLAELAQKIAEALTRELGFERAALFVDWQSDAPAVVVVASQDDRFADDEAALARARQRAARAEDLLPFGAEAIRRAAAVHRPACRTGDDAAEASEDIFALPLLAHRECVGAMVCTRIDAPHAARPMARASGRSLELVAGIIGQCVATAQARWSLAAAHSELEEALGASRNRLRRNEESLRHESCRVAELVTELGRAQRAKDRFLSLLSHELRTPLAVMIGFGSLLHDGEAGPLNPEQRELVHRLLTNGTQLECLIDDLLLVAAAAGASVQPSLDTVDLGVVVGEALSSLSEVPSADTRLSVSIAPEARKLRTDRRLLRRIVRHLLSNAVKFTPAGRIRVEAERDARAGQVRLRVLDTGIGIAPDQHRRILECFERGELEPARGSRGIGLGLNVVGECLRILDGHLEILPDPPGGTRVEVWIPDGAARAGTSTASRSPHHLRSAGVERHERTAVSQLALAHGARRPH